MKMEEIKALKDEKLNEKLLEVSKEQMNLRFQKATGTLENPNRLRELKKDRARLKTEQTARQSVASSQ